MYIGTRSAGKQIRSNPGGGFAALYEFLTLHGLTPRCEGLFPDQSPGAVLWAIFAVFCLRVVMLRNTGLQILR